MENLYDILEVSKKASKEVIEKAYKTLAKKYHPDVQTPENKSNAEEMMKKINEAYSVLSDEQKRNEYDKKLLEQENLSNLNEQSSNINYQNNNNYQNYNQNIYNQNNYNETPKNNNVDFNNWREVYSNLSRKEQAKVRNKIEKEANEEIKKQYQSYLRSLGYKIKHKWTFKDFITLAIVIMILVSIFIILWCIPNTHDWMIEIYNNNIVVRIIVNIIIGIYKGIIQFFSDIFNF
ncbi:MAG: DnaJ domain-containing protein [Clostridia bacterium]